MLHLLFFQKTSVTVKSFTRPNSAAKPGYMVCYTPTRIHLHRLLYFQLKLVEKKWFYALNYF